MSNGESVAGVEARNFSFWMNSYADWTRRVDFWLGFAIDADNKLQFVENACACADNAMKAKNRILAICSERDGRE